MKIIHQNEKKNRTFYWDENKDYMVYDIPNIVAVLPVLPNKQVVLVEQYRVPANERTIELVCGGIEKGESIEAAAIREVEEEIGYTVSELINIGTYVSCPAYTTETVHLFIAKLNENSIGQRLEEHEQKNNLKKKLFSMEEAFKICSTRVVKPELKLALMHLK